jgi:hypothetical protein
MSQAKESGIIRVDEAYSKQSLLSRLGVSQRCWDKMLDEGLPYTNVGHTRWVTGDAIMNHLKKFAQTKRNQAQ